MHRGGQSLLHTKLAIGVIRGRGYRDAALSCLAAVGARGVADVASVKRPCGEGGTQDRPPGVPSWYSPMFHGDWYSPMFHREQPLDTGDDRRRLPITDGDAPRQSR